MLKDILREGELRFTKHCQERMNERNLTTQDAANVLRGGWVEFDEEEKGTWRYRMTTHQMTFVVVFRDESTAVILSGWRK